MGFFCDTLALPVLDSARRPGVEGYAQLAALLTCLKGAVSSFVMFVTAPLFLIAFVVNHDDMQFELHRSVL